MADYARGERLQELRAEKRMSREDVAHEIGVTTKSLYEWEKNNGAIKWDNAKRLGKFYKVEPSELVTREPNATLRAQTELREQLDRVEGKLDTLLNRPTVTAAEILQELEKDEIETLDRYRRQRQQPKPTGRPSARKAPGSQS